MTEHSGVGPDRATGTTPQNLGRRFAAAVVDTVAVAVILAGTWLVLTDAGDPNSFTGGGFVIDGTRHAFTREHSGRRSAWLVLVAVVLLANFVLLPALRGSSLGRRLLGLRIVRRDGRPPGLLRFLVRQILWVVDGFPYFLPLVAIILASRDPEHRRLGDRVAGVAVVVGGASPAAGSDDHQPRSDRAP